MVQAVLTACITTLGATTIAVALAWVNKVLGLFEYIMRSFSDGTFSDIPQNIYLRVKREDTNGLFGFPLNKASKACKVSWNFSVQLFAAQNKSSTSLSNISDNYKIPKPCFRNE